MPWIIRVKREFNACHFLTNYKGGDEPLHGHTWTVEFFFKVDKLDSAGVGIDFIDIHRYLEDILPDHRCLNEIYNFSPSAENLAKHFFETVKKKFPQLIKVVVWETPQCGAEYYESS